MGFAVNRAKQDGGGKQAGRHRVVMHLRGRHYEYTIWLKC